MITTSDVHDPKMNPLGPRELDPESLAHPNAKGKGFMSSIFVDSLVYSAQALRGLVAIVGPDRVLLGTDFPFDMGVADPLGRLDAAGLTPHDRALVAGRNAQGLNLVH